MTNISLGSNSIDLERLIESKLLIQANSGGGKSWTIRRLLEQSNGKVQQIVLDIEGEFGSLRESLLLVGCTNSFQNASSMGFCYDGVGEIRGNITCYTAELHDTATGVPFNITRCIDTRQWVNRCVNGTWSEEK